MRLNKYAGWGRLQPAPRRRPSVLPGNLTAIEQLLRSIAKAPASGGTTAVPSLAAFKIIACLGQVRDAVLDQTKATPKSVNTLLARAARSRSAQDAHASLVAIDAALAKEFEAQFQTLSPRGFATVRRARLAELIAFESKLSGLVK